MVTVTERNKPIALQSTVTEAVQDAVKGVDLSGFNSQSYHLILSRFQNSSKRGSVSVDYSEEDGEGDIVRTPASKITPKVSSTMVNESDALTVTSQVKGIAIPVVSQEAENLLKHLTPEQKKLQLEQQNQLIAFLSDLKNHNKTLFNQINERCKRDANVDLEEVDKLEEFMRLNQHLGHMFYALEDFAHSILEKFILFLVDLFTFGKDVKGEVEKTEAEIRQKLAAMGVPKFKDDAFLDLIELVARSYHNDVLTDRFRQHLKERMLYLVEQMLQESCNATHDSKDDKANERLVKIAVSFFALIDGDTQNEHFIKLHGFVPYRWRNRSLSDLLTSLLPKGSKCPNKWKEYFNCYDSLKETDKVLEEELQEWFLNPMLPHERKLNPGYDFSARWYREEAYFKSKPEIVNSKKQVDRLGLKYKPYHTIAWTLDKAFSTLCIDFKTVAVQEGAAADIALGAQAVGTVLTFWCPPASAMIQAVGQGIELFNRQLAQAYVKRIAKNFDMFFNRDKHSAQATMERLTRVLSLTFQHYSQVVYNTETDSNQKLEELAQVIWQAIEEYFDQYDPKKPVETDKDRVTQLYSAVMKHHYIRDNIINRALLVGYADQQRQYQTTSEFKQVATALPLYYIPKFTGFPDEISQLFSEPTQKDLQFLSESGNFKLPLEGSNFSELPPGMRSQEELNSFTGISDDEVPDMVNLADGVATAKQTADEADARATQADARATQADVRATQADVRATQAQAGVDAINRRLDAERLAREEQAKQQLALNKARNSAISQFRTKIKEYVGSYKAEFDELDEKLDEWVLKSSDNGEATRKVGYLRSRPKYSDYIELIDFFYKWTNQEVLEGYKTYKNKKDSHGKPLVVEQSIDWDDLENRSQTTGESLESLLFSDYRDKFDELFKATRRQINNFLNDNKNTKLNPIAATRSRSEGSRDIHDVINTQSCPVTSTSDFSASSTWTSPTISALSSSTSSAASSRQISPEPSPSGSLDCSASSDDEKQPAPTQAELQRQMLAKMQELQREMAKLQQAQAGIACAPQPGAGVQCPQRQQSQMAALASAAPTVSLSFGLPRATTPPTPS